MKLIKETLSENAFWQNYQIVDWLQLMK